MTKVKQEIERIELSLKNAQESNNNKDTTEEEVLNKNKKYYKENKASLQAKYKAKVSCPLCQKSVSKGSLNYHLKKSKLCMSAQELNKRVKELHK